MTDESVASEIIQKAKDYDYKSAKFRLALVNDGGTWEILVGKIFLDICEPKEDQTLLKEENFALVDFWAPYDFFEEFVSSIGEMNIGDIVQDGQVNLPSESMFSFGDYALYIVGNFPDAKLRFQGRQTGKNHYGVNYPFYYADYAVHPSVAAKRYPELDLTGSEIPFNNVIEALNYFWDMKYEEHGNLSHYLSIYLPIFDGHIDSFEIRDKEIDVKISINEERTKLEELTVGFIAKDTSGNEHRKKYDLQKNKLNVKLDFKPNEVNVYLYLKNKKIDEYKYYDYKQPRMPLVNRTLDAPFLESSDDELRLLDESIINNLPLQIQNLLLDGETAFNSGLYRPTAIMFRSAIEEGITLLLKQIGKEKELQNNKMEIGLDRKINLISEYMPTFRQVKGELKDVKWFGDKSVHEANMPITKQDILNNLEPKLRLILAKFVEELEKN